MVLRLLGFGFGIGGGTSLIHILLVVAAIVLVYNLASGRRTVEKFDARRRDTLEDGLGK